MDNMILAVRRYPRPMRTVIGGVMTLVACIHLGIEGLALMRGNPLVERSLVAGLVAALATALGTLPVLLAQRLSARTQDTLFGFGAGVMLSACAFSLVMPGLAAARESLVGAGAWSAGAVVGSAMLLGGLVLFGLERLLPHEHFIKGREGASAQKLRRTWLFVIAITLHNLPEGIAIGISQAGSEGVRANALAIGIAIQDLPEGLVVASALLAAGYRRRFAVLLGVLSGLVEPLGAVAAALAIGVSQSLLPWGLGLAAGAMLFVISHEIIPESHRQGHEAHATAGLMVGFVIMMLLDTTLA